MAYYHHHVWYEKDAKMIHLSDERDKIILSCVHPQALSNTSATNMEWNMYVSWSTVIVEFETGNYMKNPVRWTFSLDSVKSRGQPLKRTVMPNTRSKFADFLCGVCISACFAFILWYFWMPMMLEQNLMKRMQTNPGDEKFSMVYKAMIDHHEQMKSASNDWRGPVGPPGTTGQGPVGPPGTTGQGPVGPPGATGLCVDSNAPKDDNHEQMKRGSIDRWGPVDHPGEPGECIVTKEDTKQKGPLLDTLLKTDKDCSIITGGMNDHVPKGAPTFRILDSTNDLYGALKDLNIMYEKQVQGKRDEKLVQDTRSEKPVQQNRDEKPIKRNSEYDGPFVRFVDMWLKNRPGKDDEL